jgi:lysophospholipase L1-like esterase
MLNPNTQIADLYGRIAELTHRVDVLPSTSTTNIGTESYKNTVGKVYDKTNWTDLSDFVVNSLGATVSGGKILVPNAGVVDFSKSLQLKDFSCVNHWKIEIEFQLTQAIGAGTTGISVGIQSTNTDSLNSWANYFRMVTASNPGRMEFFSQSNGGSFASISNAGSALTFTQNDRVKLSLERSNQKVYLRAENLTNTAATPVLYATTHPFAANPIPPNTGHFAIFGQGGTCTINRITVWNNELKNPNILFIGDSKTVGYGATNLITTWVGLLGSRYKNIAISAGFGDKLTDILNRLGEISSIAPVNAVISAGSNDKRFGRTDPQIFADYTTLTNFLTGIGTNVIHLSPGYESGQDLTTQYNFIKTLAGNKFVDVFYAIHEAGSLYGDGIHWSDQGNNLVATYLRDSNLLSGLVTETEYLSA